MHSLQTSHQPNMRNLIRLKGSIQEYDWGKQGSASLVARLAPNAVGQFSLQNDKTYAELWMGTHPNSPAHLYDDSDTELLALISQDPSRYLGQTLLQKWPSTTHLPFLFKILSIAKALPLQAHPDKSLAETLHLKNPDEFVDANHKPEIAVAIGKTLNKEIWGEGITFLGFVGFRPLGEIKRFLEHIPELRGAIGSVPLINEFLEAPSKATLKNIVGQFFHRGVHDREVVREQVNSLVDRIKSDDTFNEVNEDGDLSKVVLKVNDQYPGDVGVFVTTFFMNFVKLSRAESVYIGADEIHAYLEGDIIECMAISDNVLNAAFVPPEQASQHIPTFLSMLTYTSRDRKYWYLPQKTYLHSKKRRTSMYNPPLEEFMVLATSLVECEGGRKEELEAAKGPMIGIVIKGGVRFQADGDVEDLEEGGIVYIVPGQKVSVELVGGAQSGEIWWAAAGM